VEKKGKSRSAHPLRKKNRPTEYLANLLQNQREKEEGKRKKNVTFSRGTRGGEEGEPPPGSSQWERLLLPLPWKREKREKLFPMTHTEREEKEEKRDTVASFRRVKRKRNCKMSHQKEKRQKEKGA